MQSNTPDACEQQARRSAESQGLSIEKVDGQYRLYDPKTGNSQAHTERLTLEVLEKALSRRAGIDMDHKANA